MMQVSLAPKTPTNVVMKTANFGLKLVALTRILHVVSSAISCQPVPNVGSKTLPLVKRKRFVLVTKLNVQPVFPCPMAHLALKEANAETANACLTVKHSNCNLVCAILNKMLV